MRLLVLCQDPQGPVARHRVLALLPHLAEAGFHDVDVRGIPKRVAARLATFREARHFDCVLLLRKLFTRAQLVVLRSQARRLVFDLDDAVMFRDPFRGRTRSRVREARFRSVVRTADLVLAGNAYLAGMAGEHAAPRTPVVLAPTPVDTTRFAPASTRPVGARRIGWIGSRSTLPYLRRIAAPLGRVLAERPDVRLAVMADAAPDLPFPVDVAPWSEDAEVSWLQALSIGVMPLDDDPWSRGKCGFKLLQYMACGVPAVASPVGANVRIADDGDAALLAAGDDAWCDALARLLDDDAAAQRLAARGRAHVEAHYSAAALGPPYARALADCALDERP